MITAKQIRELLDAKPFKPFRICMSDGTHRDITHHDMAWVTKTPYHRNVNREIGTARELAFRTCSA